MFKLFITTIILPFYILAQQDTATLTFISDTQEPLGLEKIGHKNTKQNTIATSILLNHIASQPSKNVFILGDVVGLGFKDKFWKTVDTFLANAKQNNKNVFACLGNHDVMLKKQKGIENFEKRFPNQSQFYYQVKDSMAIIMLNSNFKKLSKVENDLQLSWYKKKLTEFEFSSNIKAILVCCHHSPFSNSKIVGCNKKVEEQFVMPFLKTAKAKIFLSGHSHNFEHFIVSGKNFFVIGGGGGMHQPLRKKTLINDLAKNYKPFFHYATLSRNNNSIIVQSYQLNNKEISIGYDFKIDL